MKKILSYILIALILSTNLFAPFSVGWNKNNLEMKSNKAEAMFGNNNDISLTAIPSTTDKTITINFSVAFSQKPAPLTKEGVRITKTDPVSGVAEVKTLVVSDLTAGIQDANGFYVYTNTKPVVFDKLTPNITYPITVEARQINTLTFSKFGLPVTFNGDYWLNTEPIAGILFIVKTSEPVTTNPEGSQTTQIQTAQTATTDAGQNSSKLPACSVDPISTGTFMGCVVQGFYYILFVPTSYLFALAGTMFDYTFAYSVNDKSYSSAFVVQGWGLIRDFCNMLFIFIMLYVAIGTTLSLNSMKTKETIVNVVIIGLFINFSLFATQIIIDASNITARVFYNSNAIKITEKGANGVANATPGLKIGTDGTIPLSAAIVNKVNPQNLIMSATKVNSIPNNSTSGVQGVDDASLGVGQFILVIIMASAVNIVGFTVFITVAFLFIARVIGLWLAMILSPLAFFTYILPEMAGTKMIGWKNWWPETLKMAFLAPVFIFFLYIILKFLQADLITDIASKSLSGDGLGYFVSLIIPFAFIMILLIKAKKIATDMSGEFGEIVTKAGSAVGGLALGAATGGAAFAMRGTLGAMGDKLANSKFASTNGRFGRMLGDAGKWTASKSFDARKTALGTMAGKEMGVDMGKAKEGGYVKYKADTQKKREERAKSLEVKHDEAEMHDLHHKEEALQLLKNSSATELAGIQGKIDAWGLDLREKTETATLLEKVVSDAGASATAEQIAAAQGARKEALAVAKDLKDAKDRKNTIRTGGEIMQEKKDVNGNVMKDADGRSIMEGTGKYNTHNGKISTAEADKQVKDAKEERMLAEAKAREQEAFAASIEADNTYTQAEKDSARQTAEAAKSLANNAKTKHEQLEQNRPKLETGRTMNNLEFDDIPEAKQKISEINSQRKYAYAEEIQGRWFNKKINSHAAHNIKMNAEIKTEVKGH